LLNIQSAIFILTSLKRNASHSSVIFSTLVNVLGSRTHFL
jgi:hypothetical protein